MDGSEQAKDAHATNPVEWLDRHGDALYRFAYLRTRDSEQAEELVQECFMAALSAKDRFAGKASERTWLIGILKRKIIDHLRKKTREPIVDAPADPEANISEFFSKRGHWSKGPAKWGTLPEDTLESTEFWEAFRRCLEGLSPRLAAAFVLRELEDLSSDEICKIQGISTTNLGARLHRARLGLRQCLESTWFTGVAQVGA